MAERSIYKIENMVVRNPSPEDDKIFSNELLDQESSKFSNWGKLTNQTLPTKFNPEKNLIWSIHKWNHTAEELAGRIMLSNIDWLHRSVELTIYIFKKYHAKGFGYMACNLMLSHAFTKLNLNRVWLGTAKENIGMGKVAEKIGMKYEGTLTEELFIDNAYMDVIRCGITKKMWVKKHG